MNKSETPVVNSPNIKRAGIIFLICLGGLLVVIGATAVLVNAATVAKSNNVAGFADRNLITRTVTFTGADFSPGAKVSNLTLAVTLEKVDDSCGNYLGNSVFNREIYMLLSSPSGTEIVLVENIFNNGGSGNGSTFTSNSVYNGIVTITFDDSAPSQVGGTAPTAGTFRPEEPFSAFLGEDPLGDWTLTLGDSANGAPLCFSEMMLTVDGDQAPVVDDQTFSVPEGSANGTAVDTVVATDGDPDDKLTYMELGGTGIAVFEIDNALGIISVTDSAQLDFETPGMDQYTYIVEVTDSGALTDTATITINVTNSNDAPTDLAVAPSSVAEHQPVGTAVGTLTATDQDGGDSHLFTLVAGSGDDDNADFTITGDTLETAASFDHETKDTYTIRVQADDQNGGLFAKSLTITVPDGNDPPTDISLDSNMIQENEPISTTVGSLSVSDLNGDMPTYQLVAGVGDDDNGSFDIVGDELKSLAVFDYEGGQITYTVRIEADDGNGGLFEKALDIVVTNADDAATDFILSSSTITEGLATGTAVGSFTPTDVDGGTYTYNLVAGIGDSNNADFNIVGDELQSAIIFDYETQMTRTIRVQLDDGISTIEKAFTVTVQNQNEAPTDITLSSNNVMEHSAVGTAVGTLSSVDDDMADMHTYALVAGSGDADNGNFNIVGNEVQTAVDLDYETQITHTIRIETNDGNGGLFQKSFDIVVVNGNDPPSDITLDNNTIQENQGAGTAVGNLSASDPNGDSPITYTLPVGTPDNSAFQIMGNVLQSAISFDRESDDTYNITIQADDGNGGLYQKPFTITISNANDAPTAINVAPNSVEENQPISTTVGMLTAVDQDTTDTHTFALVAGSGDTHNGLFDIVGTELKTLTSFDFETALASYSIRVEANDGFGGIVTQTLAITIDDGDDPPTGLILSNATIPENMPAGSEVGFFSSIDEDAINNHNYTLVAGSGDTHNGLFQLIDEILETNAVFDYETGPMTYTIRVQTDDGSGTFSQAFVITVTDANDPPTAMPDYGGTSDEDSLLTVPASSGVLMNDDDDDDGDTLSVAGYDNFTSQNGIVNVASDGSFTYDPRTSNAAQALQSGESMVDSFTYIVQDSSNMTATTQVTLTVTGVNDDPTAVDDSAFTEENTPITFDVIANDNDPENDTLTVSGMSNPLYGTVVNNGDGTLTYTPDTDFIGQDNFTYTIEDGEGGDATGQVSIDVGESKAFIPVIVANYSPAPDLVVTNIEATASEIRVEIQNQGNAATTSGFWVDFYVDPDPVPTEVDQVWQDVSAEGLVWGVTQGLAPNETLTLIYSTAAGAPNLYYSPSNSNYSGTMAAGTAVYAQVDSSHLTTNYGGVLENHEMNNEPYNNVSSMYLSVDTFTTRIQSIR